MTSSELCYI